MCDECLAFDLELFVCYSESYGSSILHNCRLKGQSYTSQLQHLSLHRTGWVDRDCRLRAFGAGSGSVDGDIGDHGAIVYNRKESIYLGNEVGASKEPCYKFSSQTVLYDVDVRAHEL